jgi:hypothetical protein
MLMLFSPAVPTVISYNPLMKVQLDPTTASVIFNPLKSQGQWLGHRFGKRNYPKNEICIQSLMNALRAIPQCDLTLSSVYGDPLCYTHCDTLLEYAVSECSSVTVNSYLSNPLSDSTLKLLNSKQVSVVVELDGAEASCGLVHLGADWKAIKHNLDQLHSATVVFRMYKHNVNHITDLENYCQQRNFIFILQPGISVARDHSSVISQAGKWLYDVFAATQRDQYDPQLAQTVEGYHALKKYRMVTAGRNILQKPIIPVFQSSTSSPDNQTVSISATGHVFENTHLMEIFSNALCNDWVISKQNAFITATQLDSYVVSVSADLIKLAERDLDRTIYNTSMHTLLSSLGYGNV